MDINNLIRKYDYDVLMEDLRKRIDVCWSKSINICDIEEWLSNFNGKVYDVHSEKILALVLLCNFIQISHDELLHLCQVVNYEFIHSLAIIDSNYSQLVKSTTYYPIGNPSESSSLVLYFFRLSNNIPKDKFNNYPQSYSNSEFYIFIDDVSITGTQAHKYLSKFIKDNNIKNARNIYYLSLIGSEKAKRLIETLDINYISGCFIDDRLNLFSSPSYTNFNPEESILVKDFLKGYRDEVGFDPLGFMGSSLAIGFYYNVPDNSLPIFWSSINNWKPIFKRFHKLYSSRDEGESFNGRDKYI